MKNNTFSLKNCLGSLKTMKNKGFGGPQPPGLAYTTVWTPGTFETLIFHSFQSPQGIFQRKSIIFHCFQAFQGFWVDGPEEIFNPGSDRSPQKP